MKEKKWGPRIILAAFVVLICLYWVLWFFLREYADTTNHENRPLAAMPELSPEHYREIPKEFDSYFNDRLPFRNELVTLNNAIDFFVFRKSTNPRVAIGSDDWLFYCDEGDGNPIGCYQGTNLFTEEDLSLIAENLVQERDWLASLGKEFILFIAPNKERVYAEYMPERYGAPAGQYRALQLVDYLRKQTDLRVVYPYEDLLHTKASVPENIYFKTDTHWNAVGAYTGSRALLQELNIEMPSPDSGQITIASGGNTAGDLASFLGLSGQLLHTDSDWTVHGYPTNGYEMLQNDFGGAILCAAPDADPRTLYVVRDSFCSAMIPYLGSQFRESCFRHIGSYSHEDFVSRDPDVVVYETVERYLDRLADFSFQTDPEDSDF